MPMRKRLAYSALAVPNFIFRRAVDWSNRPVFYDIDTTCPQLRGLERNYQAIRAEFDALKEHLHAIPPYQELDRNQTRIARSRRGPDIWRIFFLKAMGCDIEVNRLLCPSTAAAIDRVPNVLQTCFSILEGGKSVPLHCSPYNGYLRYHLGVQVPRVAPPSMHVKDRSHTWQEGTGVLFDDTWPHEIRNDSPEMRVVLIVDIMRPMGRYAAAVNRSMLHAMRLTYGCVVANRAGHYSRMLFRERLMTRDRADPGGLRMDA